MNPSDYFVNPREKKQIKSIRMAFVGKLSGQQNEKVQMKSADNQNLQKQINRISCKFFPSNSSLSRLSLYHISFLETKGSLTTTLGSQLLAVWWAPLVLSVKTPPHHDVWEGTTGPHGVFTFSQFKGILRSLVFYIRIKIQASEPGHSI